MQGNEIWAMEEMVLLQLHRNDDVDQIVVQYQPGGQKAL